MGALAASGGISAGPAAAATSNTPIVVGGDGDLAISAGVAQGFEAGIYRFNKAGGLDGRKIQFTGFLDDGFNPATDLSNGGRLVQSKHVMAVVPFLSQVATGSSGSFLATNQVPFIGWSVNAAFEVEPSGDSASTGTKATRKCRDGRHEQALAQPGTPRRRARRRSPSSALTPPAAPSPTRPWPGWPSTPG